MAIRVLVAEDNASVLSATGGDWQIVDAPAFNALESEMKGTRQPSNGDSILSAKV